MFSQETINSVVSVEILLSIAGAVILAGIILYYAVDYLLFCRRLKKSYREEQERKAKNPLE